MLEIRPRFLEGHAEPKTVVRPLSAAEEPAAYIDKAVARAPARPAPKAAAPPAPGPEAGTPEAKVWDLLAGGAQDADSLIRGTGLSASDMAVLLLNMEISGIIRRSPAGLFEKP